MSVWTDGLIDKPFFSGRRGTETGIEYRIKDNCKESGENNSFKLSIDWFDLTSVNRKL